MIGRIIGFSLYYGLGVGSAVLAMVTVLPPLQLGNGVRPDLDGGARHAVYVEGAASCPALAIADATARCPYLAAVAAESRCPYLAAVVGSSNSCPYLRGTGRGSGCPYLEGRPGADREGPPRPSRPHGPDGSMPKAVQPDIDWVPDGAVLARLEPRDSGPTLRDRI